MRNAGCLVVALLLAGCEYGVPPDDGTEDTIDFDEYDADAGGYEAPAEPGNDWFADILAGIAWGLADGDGDGSGHGSGHGHSATASSSAARADLVRAADAADGDARGVVAVGKRNRRERFAVRVVDLDPGVPVELYAGDRFDALVAVAAGSADGRGTVSFAPEFLPAGAASLREMIGRHVELRDGSGRTLLRGRVPPLRRRGSDRRASRGYRDEDSGVRVKVAMTTERTVGRQVFRLDARGLPASAPAELCFNDRDGSMTPVGKGTADAAGRFVLRADSREGDPVPGGEEWIESLSGRAFEMRCGGEVVAAGELPRL